MLKTISNDEVHRVMSETIKAINYFRRLNIPREEVIVLMPKYLQEMIRTTYRVPVFHFDLLDVKKYYLEQFAGCKVEPSPNNTITVYHPDSPLFKELKPIEIKLKIESNAN